MNGDKNFFQRAVEAIVEGRTRQAERYVARYEREHGFVGNKVKSR
jgi:hypothetical protein